MLRTARRFLTDHLTPRQRSMLLAVKWRLRPPEPEVKLACRIVAALGGGTVIDVGANRGLYTLALARHAHSVHAFEANPHLASDLKAIVPANVDVHDFALSDLQGTAMMRVPIVRGRGVRGLGTLSQDNSFADLSVDGVEKIEVRCERLDDVFNPMAHPGPVIFMKIDVEGLEEAVLKGAGGILSTMKPVVMLETEARHGADVIAIFRFLDEAGYKSGYLHSDGVIRAISANDAVSNQRKWSGKSATEYQNNFLFLRKETANLLKKYGIETALG